jgi:diguanylate cyclase (GGDEF)-like protein/PAS domain S-box-containing protein
VNRSMRIEAAFWLALALATFAVASYFDAMELFMEFAEAHNDYQLDEIFMMFVTGSVALSVFVFRRMRELRKEILLRARVERTLRASEIRLDRMFSSSPVPMIVWSLGDHAALACNAEFESASGIESHSVIGNTAAELNLWTQPENIHGLHQKLLRDRRLRNEEVEFNCRAGDVRHALLSAELIQYNDVDAILVALNDVTEQRSLEQKLEHQAFHDALTGLANRTLFRDRLSHALARAPRSGTKPVVMFLDLDDFKRVNDSVGHAAGDELLIAVSRRLQLCLRSGDTCARLGGDEFSVLIEDSTDAEEAMQMAQRIILTLQAPYQLAGSTARVGVSIGIAVAEAADTEESVMRHADLAMYLSKAQGKGRFTVFEPSMQEEVLETLALEADLHSALEREQFRLVYQPIANIESGRTVSVEALLRWEHPTRGLLGPSQIIPIAEASGLIIELGRWVLNTACQAVRTLQVSQDRLPLLTLSVNLSGRQIAHQDLVAHVTGALEASGLPPECLVLEITESVLIHNDADVLERLWTLKRLGCRLAIDDFGTGYSSLAYLQQFPVDILKIDKSFTDRIGTGVEESPIARAIVALGNTISLQTVAEGIETPEQWSRLRELGCERGQGFFFARPDSIGALSDLMDAENPQHASDLVM